MNFWKFASFTVACASVTVCYCYSRFCHHQHLVAINNRCFDTAVQQEIEKREKTRQEMKEVPYPERVFGITGGW